jgi:hypothetical protein
MNDRQIASFGLTTEEKSNVERLGEGEGIPGMAVKESDSADK